MRNELQEQFNLFAKNSKLLENKFFWEWDTMKRTCALLYALQNKTIDYEAIKQSYKMINSKTGFVSYLNGRLAVVIACKLSLSDSPKHQLANTIMVYNKMKKLQFSSSDYLVYAAYSIAEQAEAQEYDAVIERTRAFYDGIKKHHRFLTCEDDYIYMAAFALTDEPVEDGIARAEEIFNILKPKYSATNETQGISLSFATHRNGLQLTKRLLQISDKFENAGLKMNKEENSSIMEILTLVPLDMDEIVSNVIEGFDYFKEEKTFGGWTAEKSEILLFTAALVAQSCASPSCEAGNTLITKVINRVITQAVMLLLVTTVIMG